jgi:hypothetical protein
MLWTSLFLITLATVRLHGAEVQQLVLTADVGRPEFFEDEPIFLLVALKNVGSDTAWVAHFALTSQALRLSVLRGDGQSVPVGGLIADRVFGRDWRGDPIAPGRTLLHEEPLQFRVGEEREFRRSLFPMHLAPGEYEVRLRFNAHAGLIHAGLLTLEASPITFRIRERTPAETKELTELEAIRGMAWDPTALTHYQVAAISWVARHPRDDPFLPFLLSDWLYGMEPVARRIARFDLDSLRVTVLEAERFSPAGAYITQTMVAWHPEQLPALAERLGTSVAGEMARYHVERIQYAQRLKQQRVR